MSRHHPYGGSPYEGSGFRRGGPPTGPGPDRHHHFDGSPRGRGGGRGGGGGGGGSGGSGPYDDGPHDAYDQGPPQGDLGGYQDSYYQDSNGYDGGSYGSADQNGGYDNYGTGGDFEGQQFSGPFSGRHRRGPRRERDDKLHESIIEERIQRERPCRTLFIRNIKASYLPLGEEVRHIFEEHGEVKTFFDLIANRGMVFVTFYDLRAAERARQRLQGSEIAGRPIDVHYSLPREDHGKGGGPAGDKNQEMQGTLLVALRNSISGQPIDDEEVRRKFQQFGDVKDIRSTDEQRNDQRYVEYYDTRAAEDAFDRLRHQSLQDGVMEIVLAWEEPPPPSRCGSPVCSFRHPPDTTLGVATGKKA
ncbi:hypothetical protein K488DRAFT_43981 [Vararia minispora EC-137]|uniref:Uncharacterized protein n=1 Tax=Vararia minispora EC-137 TaxID=1314806 RepID=A0ACB8QTQ6_9AGAM|nr:hypothetical protein K488DRAFT_43981 [Vararia minispora EC-137]